MRALIYCVVTVVLWYVGSLLTSAAFLTAAVALALMGVALFALTWWQRAHLDARVAAPSRDVPRGSTASFALLIENRSHIPVGVLQARLSCRYRDGHATQPLALTVQATCEGRSAMQAWVRIDAPHCGVLETNVVELVVHDPLGLCALRLPIASHAEIPVVPQGCHPTAVAAPCLARTRSQCELTEIPRAGWVPPDIYDLRAYQQGDPLRTVHWKLSARQDSLVTRVHCSEEACDAVLVVEAPPLDEPDAMDAQLEAAINIAVGLARMGASFAVAWRSTAVAHVHSVHGPADVASLGRALVVEQPCAPFDDSALEGAAAQAPRCTLQAGPELRLGPVVIARFTSDGAVEEAHGA